MTTEDRLETERMILRRFTLDDVPALYQLGTLPEIIRYAGNTPLASLEAARENLIKNPLRDYEVHGFGRLACVWKETGAVIGFSGVKHLDELGENELGYRLLPEFWGMGLATEAGLAVIDHARDVYKLNRLVSVIHPDNHASKNVVRKFGFKYEKNVEFSLVYGFTMEMYSGAI
jgi:RimJ/RimL family protein N-acetyltransferase